MTQHHALLLGLPPLGVDRQRHALAPVSRRRSTTALIVRYPGVLAVTVASN
jgi:hypothetical protein